MDKNILLNLNLDNFYINPTKIILNKNNFNLCNSNLKIFKLIANQEKDKLIILFNSKDYNLNINVQDIDGDTPLHIAVFMANYDIIKILLDYNANVDITDKWGQTPLHRLYFCLKSNNILKILQLLINHNCNFNKQDKNGNTILHLSLKQIIRLNSKININVKKFLLKLKLLIPNGITNNENISITDLFNQITF